ncbi:cadmium-translocating P-type ATPase [Hazenella sp. IB182353]|uniref:heavy metal translocating P-type ATPase n=1 Tax=Polycladospora coralii TaxID=2771432 RepID=UPI00174614B7|nr:heavy metal translocating P-type ATPase [Polycladospora coralii]MBS7530899.1 cadmium-translocating P-type ATPase [Polycladospora coralii]
MSQTEQKQVFRVHGFTCAGCATKFENNLKTVPGVTDAKVNFGAAKVTVYGSATHSALEKAGEFENLTLTPDQGPIQKPSLPFWKKRSNWFLLTSILLLLTGFYTSITLSENSQLSILFFLTSMFLSGGKLFLKGIKNLVRLEFDMNTLMTLAVLGAAAIGEWGEGATVVILFAISEALETFSMDKARDSIRSLMNITPKEALIRRGQAEMQIAVNEIEIGDILLVKPGQKIAMDGIVRLGHSSINQAAITGESIPVTKEIGDEVFAGTLNEEGYLEIEVTKHVSDNTISKIIYLVEEAQAEKAPTQAFVDRFAKYYTPAILILGILIAIVPPLFFNGTWEDWIYRGLAVLVVGCPCALVISTPIAIVTAIGNAAKNGVLIKGGIHLEQLGLLNAIAFDKTGTLTKGLPAVTDFISFEETEAKHHLSIAASIEKNAQHPLAAAVVRKAQTEQVAFYPLQQFQSLTGKGVHATIEGVVYYLGSPSLFMEKWPQHLNQVVKEQILSLQQNGKTVVLLGTDQKLLSMIGIADEIREESKAVLKALPKLGISSTVMLTGDNQATAQAIAQQIGISQVEANLLPKDKLDRIKAMRDEGKHVAMIGDGVNDAPALASANIGMAMGGAGTDTALETADITLMGDDLKKLPYAIRLSRKTLRIIKENITFSLALKILALLLIIPGWLTLWMAVFADMGATLIVALNSLRLLRVKS